MNEMKNSVQSAETGKAAYVKPTMQVYEMEPETCILTGMDSSLPGSEAKADDMVNPFGETFTDLKA